MLLSFWYCELNILKFLTIGHKKQAIQRCHFRLWEIVIVIFIDKIIDLSIEQMSD